MDAILDDKDDTNFSIQQDAAIRTHSETLKEKKKEKKRKPTQKDLENDKNLIKEMWGNMTVKESLILNEDFYSLAFFGHYLQTDESIHESMIQKDTISKLDTFMKR